MTKKNTPQFLTTHELAARWHCTRRAVQKWLHSPPRGKPQLEWTEVGRRRLVSFSSVLAWEATQAIRGQTDERKAQEREKSPGYGADSLSQSSCPGKAQSSPES